MTKTLAPVLLALLATAADAAAGNVLRVGPTRTHTTIQSAVDAASSGDLILVDPGSYEEFAVDGKGLAIVADMVSFTVLESPGSIPAIVVENVAYPDQVTIVGAHIDHGIAADNPAVHVRNNTGAVRFDLLDVVEALDLIGVNAHAVVQIDATRTFWLHQSKVWTGVPKLGQRAGTLGLDEGVSAVEVVDSDGIVQNCQLRGLDAFADYAGDALRVRGGSSVWITDDIVMSPKRSILRGGAGVYGGSAVHYFGPRKNLNRITTCGPVQYIGGAGTIENGGLYALNGDGGVGGTSQFPVLRLPTACGGNWFGETVVGAPTASIGTSMDVWVRTQFSRQFVTAVSLNTSYKRMLSTLKNRCMVDLGAPFFAVVASGTTAATVPLKLSIPVPNEASLIGAQVVFQTVIGPIGGPFEALTAPTLAVITP